MCVMSVSNYQQININYYYIQIVESCDVCLLFLFTVLSRVNIIITRCSQHQGASLRILNMFTTKEIVSSALAWP